jgi:hypothetical protein
MEGKDGAVDAYPVLNPILIPVVLHFTFLGGSCRRRSALRFRTFQLSIGHCKFVIGYRKSRLQTVAGQLSSAGFGRRNGLSRSESCWGVIPMVFT